MTTKLEGIDGDAVKQIANLAFAAANKTPTILNQLDVYGTDTFCWHPHPQGGGEMERIARSYPPRKYTGGGTDGIIDMVKLFWKRRALLDQPVAVGQDREDIAVFVYQGLIQVLLDETKHRHDVLSCQLVYCDQFKQLVDIDSGDNDGQFTQRDLVRLLRVELNGRYTPSDLIARVRRIAVANNGQAEQTTETARASYKRETIIEAVGTTEADLEAIENAAVELPVFKNHFTAVGVVPEYRINLSITLDLQSMTFDLRPKAGQIERVLAAIDNEILERFKTEFPGLAVFRGLPS